MMRMSIMAGSVALALWGCATAPKTVTIATPYNPDDFVPWTEKGSSTLRGQAFLKTVGGDVKTCAGNDVILMPATKYNKEVMVNFTSINSSVKFTNRSPDAARFNVKAICDAQGNFSFSGLPSLEWYVITDVFWGVPSGAKIERQGGPVEKLMALSPGENSVTLTDRDRF